MTVEPGDVVRVTWVMVDASANQFQNVFYWKHSGVTDVSDSDFISAAVALLDDAYQYLMPFMHDDIEPSVLKCYNETQDDPLPDEGLGALAGGTGGADSLPYQNAALVTFGTGLKKSLGKKYFAPIIRAAVTGIGVPSPTLQTALGNAASEILTDLVANGQTFLVGHYRAQTTVFVEWLSGVVETLFSSQRKRKPGIGI